MRAPSPRLRRLAQRLADMTDVDTRDLTASIRVDERELPTVSLEPGRYGCSREDGWVGAPYRESE